MSPPEQYPAAESPERAKRCAVGPFFCSCIRCKKSRRRQPPSATESHLHQLSEDVLQTDSKQRYYADAAESRAMLPPQLVCMPPRATLQQSVQAVRRLRCHANMLHAVQCAAAAAVAASRGLLPGRCASRRLIARHRPRHVESHDARTMRRVPAVRRRCHARAAAKAGEWHGEQGNEVVDAERRRPKREGRQTFPVRGANATRRHDPAYARPRGRGHARSPLFHRRARQVPQAQNAPAELCPRCAARQKSDEFDA